MPRQWGRTMSVWCALGMLGVPVSLWGGPMGGSRITFHPIESKGSKDFTEKFHGGQRACVIALSLPVEGASSVAEIKLTVYDSDNKLIGTDQGLRNLVIWYPPRDGEYKIEITNLGAQPSRCYLAVK